MTSTETKAKNPKNTPRERQTRGYFKAELERVDQQMKKESERIQKPPEREFFPDIFNNLEPYQDLSTPRFVIKMPDDILHAGGGYKARATAQKMMEPWVDHKMDSDYEQVKGEQVVSPRQEGSERSEKPHKVKRDRTEILQGTILPRYPILQVDNPEMVSRDLRFSELPAIRQEVKSMFEASSQSKIEKDYKSTKEDFVKLELDRLNEVKKSSQKTLRQAYYAYLQNTPGSKRAIRECLREFDKQHGNKNENEAIPEEVEEGKDNFEDANGKVDIQKLIKADNEQPKENDNLEDANGKVDIQKLIKADNVTPKEKDNGYNNNRKVVNQKPIKANTVKPRTRDNVENVNGKVDIQKLIKADNVKSKGKDNGEETNRKFASQKPIKANTVKPMGRENVENANGKTVNQKPIKADSVKFKDSEYVDDATGKVDIQKLIKADNVKQQGGDNVEDADGKVDIQKLIKADNVKHEDSNNNVHDADTQHQVKADNVKPERGDSVEDADGKVDIQKLIKNQPAPIEQPSPVFVDRDGSTLRTF